MVYRNVEITLNLRRVQIKRQRAAGSGRFEQIGDQLGGNWNARLVFAVLARIAVIRQHGRDSPRGSAFRSEEHTSELQSQSNLVCRLLLEKKKKKKKNKTKKKKKKKNKKKKKKKRQQ